MFLSKEKRGKDSSRRPITPQMALESILSNEWLHFGRARWEQRKAAELGEFDRRVKELAIGEGTELLEKLRVEGVTPGQLEEELAAAESPAPPLKKNFIIRQDSIGHAETRRQFERDYDLERLDDVYWHFVHEDTRVWTEKTRRSIRAAVWDELGEAWKEELELLKKGLSRLRALKKLPRELDQVAHADVRAHIEALYQSVDDLLKGLGGRLRSAEKSGEFERDYRYIQTRIIDARSHLEGYTALLENPPNIVVHGATTPLEGAKIANLGPKRRARLKEKRITSVEELSLQNPDQLAWLLEVSDEIAKGIIADANKLVGDGPMEISMTGPPAFAPPETGGERRAGRGSRGGGGPKKAD